MDNEDYSLTCPICLYEKSAGETFTENASPQLVADMVSWTIDACGSARKKSVNDLLANMVAACKRYAESRPITVDDVLSNVVLFSAMLQHTALVENHPASVPKHLTGLRHWFDTGKNGGIVREGDFSKDPSLLSRAELLVAAIYKGVDPGDEIPWKIIQRGYEVLAMSSSNAQVVARTECESDMLLLPAHRIQEVAAGGQSHGVLA